MEVINVITWLSRDMRLSLAIVREGSMSVLAVPRDVAEQAMPWPCSSLAQTGHRGAHRPLSVHTGNLELLIGVNLASEAVKCFPGCLFLGIRAHC